MFRFAIALVGDGLGEGLGLKFEFRLTRDIIIAPARGFQRFEKSR